MYMDHPSIHLPRQVIHIYTQAPLNTSPYQLHLPESTDTMSHDMRYKVFSPNFARLEELGARGLTLDHVKDAFRFGNIKSFATHGNYLTAVQSLSFSDKGEDNNPDDSTYRCVPRIWFV